MLIPPGYLLTPTITKHLQSIEASREIIDTLKIPQEVETNIRRQSILKSSLFSARIEGNPLTLVQITFRPSKDQKKQEVYNILKALQFVQHQRARDITLAMVRQLHKKTMAGLTTYENKSSTSFSRSIDSREKNNNTDPRGKSSNPEVSQTEGPRGFEKVLDKGKFRKEVSAIFNTAGIAVYMPPPPSQINYLMERLLKFINSDKEPFVPIRAAIAHYTFEKIHPFLDGNGRLGRLLLQAVLEKSGYGMKGLLTIEEYLDNHRSYYYDMLATPEKNVTEYLEFMLESISTTAEKVKKIVVGKKDVEVQDYLLPRRAEIFNIIKDHVMVNFDQIRRRFMAVNERTLRYDLKKLQDANLIRKRGTTKGVYYEILKK